jgi:PAS domain S-box-containing protein
MNDVASSGADLQLMMLESVSDALGLAIFVCDRNDEVIFASRPILQFYPVNERFLARGTRLRDFLGAVFDLGVRSGTATEKSRRRVNRDEWISERVSLHWRERYDVVERIARQRWINVRKRRLPNGLCVVSIADISEQKKKDEQIQLDVERVELTEGILDGLPNPICVKDRSLSYVAVNKAFCALHGMSPEQILGRSVWDMIEPELAEKFEKSDRMVLETGREYSLPEQIVRANGDDCWVVTHKFRIGDPQRALLVTCMNDVTDVVVGFDEGSMPADMARHMAVRDYGAFEPAQNCHDPFQALDMHVLAQTASLPAVPPMSTVTKGDRRRVLVVTASFAREAEVLEGLATLGHEACAVRSLPEMTAFLEAIAAAGLVLDIVLIDPPVRPSGENMGPAHLVLDPRWSDVELGVAIEARLQPGLPEAGIAGLDAAAAALPEPPADWDIVLPATRIPTSDIDVLVAEDNEINQFVFSQILEGLGLSYKIAVNGEEAVRLWQTFRPRLVFMDISMPVMNGFDATRAIRTAEGGVLPRTPIVAVTAQALDIDLDKARAAGMDEHIVKPISPDMIERVRARYLDDGADAIYKA